MVGTLFAVFMQPLYNVEHVNFSVDRSPIINQKMEGKPKKETPVSVCARIYHILLYYMYVRALELLPIYALYTHLPHSSFLTHKKHHEKINVMYE